MLEINATILLFAISFLVFVFALQKILWQPIIEIGAERETALRQKKEQAAYASTESSQIEAQIRQSLQKQEQAFAASLHELQANIDRYRQQSREKIQQNLQQWQSKWQAEAQARQAQFRSELPSLSEQLSQQILLAYSNTNK